MKKIFKQGLLTVIAVMAISATCFAQETAVMPPMPPMPPMVTVPKVNTREFNKQMADLKVKMRKLQKQMKSKSFNANKDMALAFKDFDKTFNESFKGFDKTFNESFKDFGKNFAGSFQNMAPDMADAFKGENYNNNFNTDEYKKKLASGEITEKVKNYSKSYSVDANDVLQISNSFGKIVVNTWAKNEFKVDVQMKFSADDEDYVNNMINGSSIIDSKVGSVVSFKTNLAHNNGINGNNNMEINYAVYMPAGNAVNISNKFGNVYLPDFKGKTTINLSFGNLLAHALSNADNDIQIRYTQEGTSQIATLNGGRLKISYGKLNAGVVSGVNAAFSFSDVNIARLKTSADVSIKFGNGLNIKAIDSNTKNININAANTSVNLDFKEAPNYNFDVTTKFGSFNYNTDKIKLTSKTPSDDDRGWSSTKTYKGNSGKGTNDTTVVINGKFTEIKFY
ncbi:hypothetical protein [Mucilaginibacter phyllosphaerae]|uniref:Adhesin domain-containing protein n=1 Tax=Mucilaginibacter phyllosphaerae TaxID=1812349 RepID=A0A4Y8A7Q3_9SPHI|nr:hypothetical protein [Mucilaginibacter phyllosphaerae]MBB3971022.1 hypothetical protein [Mucilaginibacter phyllosphaerae]TEW63765.1 hypothetical protein E2R65_18520 [Mucilaginibacter phyllosphaerae]GGH22013.1 hypothetical protein GCM10007352_35060 [Mucilaginibacter phyllosphaerae]